MFSENVSYLLLEGGLSGIDGAVEQHVASGTLRLLPPHTHGGYLLIINVHSPHGAQGDWISTGNWVEGENYWHSETKLYIKLGAIQSDPISQSGPDNDSIHRSIVSFPLHSRNCSYYIWTHV